MWNCGKLVYDWLVFFRMNMAFYVINLNFTLKVIAPIIITMDVHSWHITEKWRPYYVKTTSFWRNYVKMTSFWRYNDVIITSCVQWEFCRSCYPMICLLSGFTEIPHSWNVVFTFGDIFATGCTWSYQNDNSQLKSRAIILSPWPHFSSGDGEVRAHCTSVVFIADSYSMGDTYRCSSMFVFRTANIIYSYYSSITVVISTVIS